MLNGLHRQKMVLALHRVGVNVQAQFEGLRFFARGLLRANFGGIELWFDHVVGGCSAFAPARQLLMSSPKSGRHERNWMDSPESARSWFPSFRRKLQPRPWLAVSPRGDPQGQRHGYLRPLS
jgi:hypothetical protein